MAERRLTIAVKADTREGEKLKKFFGDLAMEGNKAAKAFQGISLNVLGKEGQKGAVAKAILEQKNLLKDLGVHGQKLGKIFETDVAKGAQAMGDKLKAVNDRIKTLTDSYEKWVNLSKDAKAQGASSAVFDAAADDIKRQIQDALGEKNGTLKARGGFADKHGLGGAFGELKDMLSNSAMGRLLMAGTPIGLALGAGKLAGMVNQQYLQGRLFDTTFAAQQAAIVGQSTGALDTRRRFGNMRELIWDQGMNQKAIDDAASAAVQTEYDRRSVSGKITNGRWWEAAKGAAMWWTESYKESKAENIARSTAAVDAQTRINMRDLEIAKNPLKAAQVDIFNENVDRAVMNGWRWGGGPDSFWNLYGRSAKEKLPVDILENIQHSLMAGGGRSALRFSGAVGAHVRGGMSSGAAASIAAGGMAAGDTLSAISARGLDPVVREMLGAGINNYLGPHSIISGHGYEASALGDALSAGLAGQNSAVQLRMLQQNMGGMGRLDNLTAGSADAWQKSVNLSHAIKNYGAGGSIYGANALANVSFSDLIKYKDVPTARLPASMRAFGFTTDTINKQYDSVVSSFFGRFANNANDQTPGAKLLRQVMGKGGDFKAWGAGASKDQKEMLAGYLSQVGGGLFGDVTDTEGIVRILTGGGERRLGGGRGGAGSGEMDPTTSIFVQKLQYAGTAVEDFTKGLKAGTVDIGKAAENLTAAEMVLQRARLSNSGGAVPTPPPPSLPKAEPLNYTPAPNASYPPGYTGQ